MRTLYERIGGRRTIAKTVDDFCERLTHDPRVLHQFEFDRLDSLKAGHRAWLANALGSLDDGPVADLREAHRHLEISNEQVNAVMTHLDAAFDTAGIDDELRRQVMSLITRLWYARLF
jgi:hemoglobin